MNPGRLAKGVVVFFFILAEVVPVWAADESICSDDSYVTLHDSGSVKTCRLNDDYHANGVTCKDDTLISFYASGELESCILAGDTTVGDMSCKADGKISFYRDGSLKLCVKTEYY